MKTVWKVPLQWPMDEQRIRLPEGAQLLTVQKQGETLCLWARVDPTALEMEYVIRTCGTGHEIADDAGAYLGTWQQSGGALVFHAFGKAVA